MIKEFKYGFLSSYALGNNNQQPIAVVLSDTGPVLEAEESDKLMERICIKAHIPW